MKFFIPYTPYPYCRPRFNGVYGFAYNKQDYTDYKMLVKNYVKKQMKEKKLKPFVDCPVVVKKCVFYFFPPQSWSEKKKTMAINGVVKHTSKPDTDNLLKGLLDALNGIVWEDDKLVYKFNALEKAYTRTQEGIEIEIESVS